MKESTERTNAEPTAVYKRGSIEESKERQNLCEGQQKGRGGRGEGLRK